MRENPYPGVNAHLNSLLQTPGDDEQTAIWPSFHSQHIAHIVDALNAALPGQYFALAEQSLQTRGPDVGGAIGVQRAKPDVSVYQTGQAATPAAQAAAVGVTWEAALAEVLEPIKPLRAAVIRELLPQKKLGRVVARIELLSPANKPGGSYYEVYAVKRVEAVEMDVPLVEIDYLHETPSPVLQLPAYPSDPNAYPYSILVSDPRPDWMQGKFRMYGFGVGELIKSFPLPLAEEEKLHFDLNAVYQHTFKAGRWGDLLDYTLEPERFATYRADDQMRIRAIMAALKT